MAFVVLVEAAWGADLFGDPDDWEWTDISTSVRYNPGVSIERGRSDEEARTQPGKLTLTLDNTDGQFTPGNPMSPWYPYVRENTPIRVSVNGTSRGTYFVDTWPLAWDASGNEKHVSVAAGGLLRLISRSMRRNADGDDIRSALRRSIGSDPALVAYWPCEDESGSESLAEVAGGGIPGSLAGDPSLASESTLPGSDSLPTLAADEGFRAVVVPSAALSGWTLLCFMRIESEQAFANAAALYVHTPDGTIREWQIVISTGSPATVDLLGMTTPGDQSSDTLGAAAINFTDPLGVEMYGRWVCFEINVEQNGTSIDWRWAVIVPEQTSSVSGTEASATLGNITQIDTKHNQVGEISFGHLAIIGSGDVTTHPQAMNGWAGELPRERIDRVCGEEGIPYAAADSNAADEVVMGAQGQQSVLQVLEEAAATGGGTLVERLSGRLGYAFAGDRYNADVDMALDLADGEVQPGLELVRDDMHLRNDVTASRPGGSSARHVDEDHVAARGRYDATITVNPSADSDLPQYAQWAVHLGTVEDLRVTSLSLNLNRSSVTDWLTCDIWSRVTAANPPAELPPGVTVDVHIEGYAEQFDEHDWRVALNTSPAAPWQVVELDGAGNLSRADTDGCELLADVTASGTALLVATTEGPRWGAQQPFDLDVNLGGVPGERVTCTAKTDRACTYVGVGAVDHDNNASVTPGYPTGTLPGDLLLCLAAIRETAATVDTPGGWEALLDGDNVVVLGRLHDPYITWTFESDTEAWVASGGSIARSTAQKNSGSASLLLTVSGSPSQAYTRTPMQGVTAGRSYYAAMWVRSGDGHADVFAAIDWFDVSQVYISTSAPVGTAAASGTWEHRSVTGIAPAGAVYAQLGPTLGTSPPNGEQLWIDDVEWTETPTVSFTGGGANDTTSAQIAGFRYAQCRTTFAQMQTNASAQNVAYPAGSVDRDRSLVIYVGAKQDDWTSVASPGTEIDEPDTTTGDDQGIVWAYTIQTTAAAISSGSFTVTGGASAVSKGGLLIIPTDVQTLTVTRAINGVSRAWSAGAGARLWKPNVLGM